MPLGQVLQSLLNELAGFSVLTSPETVATAQDLLYELRPDAGVAAQAAGAPIAAVEASANSSPAADAGQLAEGRQAPINPLAYPQSFSDESGAPNPEQGAAFIGAVATAGIIGLALTIATVLFILQSLQSR